MTEMIPSVLSDIWVGISSVPFLDFGFNCDKVIIGAMVVNVALLILNRAFGIGSSEKANVGRNARHKNKRNEVE